MMNGEDTVGRIGIDGENAVRRFVKAVETGIVEIPFIDLAPTIGCDVLQLIEYRHTQVKVVQPMVPKQGKPCYVVDVYGMVECKIQD